MSASPDYRAMLEELRRAQPRPTALGAGTLLKSPPQAVRLRARSSARRLDIATDDWRLELTKDHLGFKLTNQRTGLAWQLLGSGDSSSSVGFSWTERTPFEAPYPPPPVTDPARFTTVPPPPPPDPTAPAPPDAPMLRPTSVREISHSGNTWTFRVNVIGSGGSPRAETVELTLAVLSPTVIHLALNAAALGPDAALRLNWSGSGPFFGLGERFRESRLDGLRTTLRPLDLLRSPGRNWTYIPVPLLYTPRGLGLFLDTGEVTTFDLSRTAEDLFSIEFDHASLDTYLFTGSGPQDILRSYASLTGTTPLSPPWAFGVWICAYQSPDSVINDAKRLRREGIPSSAIWLFDDMREGGITGWPLWWTGYYPQARGLTDELHRLGFKALTYVHPYLRSVLAPYTTPNPVFVAQDAAGALVHNSAGKPDGPGFEPFVDGNIDFTSPAAVDWYETEVRHIVLDENFDGWMEDFGEWIRDEDRFASGNSGREMANLHPFLYHKLTYQIAHDAKPDIVPFVRSGYAGSHAYTSVVWGGDQFPDWSEDYGLPSVVDAGISAGLSGFGVWGPDIADNGHSRELWTRWVEFGALTPIMRTHPWEKPANAVNLWTDAETLSLFREYARLHTSLFPYLYTYAHQSNETGLPIMRHPMLVAPDEPGTYNAGHTYFLGDDLLIAPVLEEHATTRDLYLPKGDWVDFWTGERISGGRTVIVAAPLDRIPILVRAGSVLPFLNAETQTLAGDLSSDGTVPTPTNDLTWRVFPSGKTGQQTFHLYDGRSATLRETDAGISVQLSGASSSSQYDFIIPVARKPSDVRLGGVLVPEMRADQQQRPQMFWEMETTGRAVHIHTSGTNPELSVSY